jgi:hypothetical protein
MTISKHIYSIKHLLLGLLISFSFVGVQAIAAPLVLAAEPSSSTTDIKAKKDDCKIDTDAGETLSSENCGIIKLVVVITNILSGIAGLVIIGTIIFGGVQYSMAGPDPSKVQAAKHKITTALLALVLFIFGYAFLQWIVPGGLF